MWEQLLYNYLRTGMLDADFIRSMIMRYGTPMQDQQCAYHMTHKKPIATYEVNGVQYEVLDKA